MADERARAHLLGRIIGDWRPLEDLAAAGEPERRRLLRSHRDVPFRGEVDEGRDIEQRRTIDEALGRLMQAEVGIELGVLRDDDVPSTDALRTLMRSSAFARYVNSYLYFGVRFVTTRVLCEHRYDLPTQGQNRIVSNELPLALPCPPGLSLRSDHEAASIEGWFTSEKSSADIRMALDFLDDIGPGGEGSFIQEGRPDTQADGDEHAQYELWLRGLAFAQQSQGRFEGITRGLVAFVTAKAAFYEGLEARHVAALRERGRLEDAGTAKNPLTARFGLLDLYWLARLLRADVSSVGIVSYRGDSWIKLLANRAGGADKGTILELEGILQAVFSFSCYLVENAVDIARDQIDYLRNRETFTDWPDQTATWRQVFDEEVEEIAKERLERGFLKTEKMADTGYVEDRPPGRVGWSRRVRTGEHVEDLVGLAFSGGGIRSATFNLGVLQRLKELDLLRSVDYLSTVSGGGYIGAWLLGNVRRTDYWLSQLTDWGPSVDHLRRFSNYLAPRSGIMSVDTWTMWASWIRNAFLIQLTAVVWLSVLVVGARLAEAAFTWHRFAALAIAPGNLILAPLVILLTISVCANVRRQTHSVEEWQVLAYGVTPAWVGAFITAAMMWAGKPASKELYSTVFKTAWELWAWPLLIMGASFWILAAISIDRKVWQRVVFGGLIAVFSMVVVYLAYCGVRWLFGQWNAGDPQFAWYAYVVGPPLVLFAMTLPVVLLIGLVGNDSEDWRREWWTRFGSWIAITGVCFLLLSLVSVFGPLATLSVFDERWGTVQWSTVLTWIGTIIGGLLAGGGDKTTGNSGSELTSKALEWFTLVAALLFIVGAVLFVATALHVLLVNIFTDHAIAAKLYWPQLSPRAEDGGIHTSHYWLSLVVLALLGAAFSWRFEINIFGLNQFYRNRLIRCYLGATRWLPGLRKPHKFTGFDGADDLPLSVFRHAVNEPTAYRGPFPIVNGSLNLGGSSDLGVHTRHSASFVFTPLRSGADRKAVGYAPTVDRRCEPGQMCANDGAFAGGVDLGQAISVSGAAASPNMGYSTSPLVAFLLTMFNVRLAWWFPNPGLKHWNARWLWFSMWYLGREMLGLADENRYFINVSDGGHFENLGIYELVRRRCKVIIAADAECDPELAFGSLGNVIRLCQTDFCARIDIDVESIRRQKDTERSQAHCAIGRITYSNGMRGYLVYLKSSVTGDEEEEIKQYRAGHADFPHETTADQFFAEDQFESYRGLGYHITSMTFRDVERERSLVHMAARLANLCVPASVKGESFVGQAQALDEIWERFRTTKSLHSLHEELTANTLTTVPGRIPPDHLIVCMELFQLMENVFIALRLNEFWLHPDNRGWVELFTTWSKSGTFRGAWSQASRTFSMAFVYFCEKQLGLVTDSVSEQ